MIRSPCSPQSILILILLLLLILFLILILILIFLLAVPRPTARSPIRRARLRVSVPPWLPQRSITSIKRRHGDFFPALHGAVVGADSGAGPVGAFLFVDEGFAVFDDAAEEFVGEVGV